MADQRYLSVPPPEGARLLTSHSRGLPLSLGKLLKRRQAIEPNIERMKTDGLLASNWLKVSEGDAIHIVLCGAGHNLRLILAPLRLLCCDLIALVRLATNVLQAACERVAYANDDRLGGALSSAHARRWAWMSCSGQTRERTNCANRARSSLRSRTPNGDCRRSAKE